MTYLLSMIMYWDRSLVECRWPCSQDPLPRLLGNHHRLFWNPQFDHSILRTNQKLQDLCDWANHGLSQGIEEFVNDRRNHYDIANLVKLNIWTHDIRTQGIVKPWLILDWGNGTYEAGTGDSRLRILEILPEILCVPALVSTHRDRESLYQNLEPVSTIDRLAGICGAEPNQHFLFRPTDDHAPFGIYWYEYDSSRTRHVTPGEPWCVTVFQNYCRQALPWISATWFDQLVDWQIYAGTVQ